MTKSEKGKALSVSLVGNFNSTDLNTAYMDEAPIYIFFLYLKHNIKIQRLDHLLPRCSTNLLNWSKIKIKSTKLNYYFECPKSSIDRPIPISSRIHQL